VQVLIAGGSGYIERALTKHLLDQRHGVVVLSRNPQNTALPSSTVVAGWDGVSPQGWGHMVETTDAIVNLTGENLAGRRWTPARLEKIIASRLDPGRALIEAIVKAAHKPTVFFQASAVGYYGKLDDQIVTEDSPPGQDALAKIVVNWEDSIAPAEELGVRVVVGRSGLVLSRQSLALKPLIFQYKYFAGGPLGDGKQWWSWITLDDEVRAIQYLLEKGDAHGAYNLTAPEPLTMRNFGCVLASVLRRPFWLPTPAFALRMIFGEMSTVLLDGQRAIPKRLLDLGFTFQYPKLRPAVEKILS